jgi:phosphatidylserine/phosphatidylglycerophosphate/cardiolipin synthase-like enzyme
LQHLTDFRSADLAIGLGLMGRDYVYTTARLIDASLSSIYFTVFQSSYTPGRTSKPDLIVDALVRAHQRGVKVNVLINFSGNQVIITNNKTLSYYLADRGVPVRFAGRGHLVHGKVIIIDGETVIMGSHNLTQRGLWTNYEASIAVYSPTIGSDMIRWFVDIWTRCKEVGAPG